VKGQRRNFDWIFLSVDMSHTQEISRHHNDLVEFLDTVMLPDARLVCSGNRAAATRLKKNMIVFRRQIRDIKSRCSEFPGTPSLTGESISMGSSGRQSTGENISEQFMRPARTNEEPLRKRYRPTPEDADFIALDSDSDEEEMAIGKVNGGVGPK